ncbi:MAG: PaaI family thioesterase [Acidimicrobiia bacterium]
MIEFNVSDPEFRQRVIADFGRQKVMKTMGIILESVEPGEIQLQVPFRDDLTQQNGYLHAGVLSTALDTACGFSAYTLMSTDASVLTIENKINLLRPAKDGPFRVVAKVIKPGRTVLVSEGKLYDVGGKLVATMSATNMAVPLRPVD